MNVQHGFDPAAFVALLVGVAIGPHGKAGCALATHPDVIALAEDPHAADFVGRAVDAIAALGGADATHPGIGYGRSSAVDTPAICIDAVDAVAAVARALAIDAGAICAGDA